MPVTAILSVAALAVDVYGRVKTAKAEKKAGESAQEGAELSAQQSDYNAAVAHLQSEDALARGADEEAQFRTKVKGLIGSQRVGFATGGVEVGSGSALDVQADSAYLGELDARTIRGNAQREAWGYSVEAENATQTAAVTRKSGQIALQAGKNAATASYIGAAGTALAGGSLIAQRYGWGK